MNRMKVRSCLYKCLHQTGYCGLGPCLVCQYNRCSPGCGARHPGRTSADMCRTPACTNLTGQWPAAAFWYVHCRRHLSRQAARR